MLLSSRVLNSVSDANNFNYADQAEWTAGDTVDLYFQLVDLTKDKTVQGWKPQGRRYIPQAGATLSVTLNALNDSSKVVRAATMPYSADDRSIWKVSILGTDAIQGTVAIDLVLTEGSKKTYGRVECMIKVRGQGAL